MIYFFKKVIKKIKMLGLKNILQLRQNDPNNNKQ